jgi:DNA polymerase/3'-5' exonuclease PolX
MDYKTVIIHELDTLRRADIAKKEPFSAKAYAKVIEQLKAKTTPIQSIDDVKDIPGIGKKIKLKIEEILETGSLKAATEARKETNLESLDILQGVHGIGPVKAKQLVETKGIKTLADLQKAVIEDPDLLNDVQKMGLKYYADAMERIPRHEMAQHETLILNALDPRFTGIVVGSYRRGAADSGDIDVLLMLPDTMSKKEQGELFKDTIDMLKDSEYIVDTLAQGPKKFLGYVRLDNEAKVRRLDLLMTPKEEFAYAILYFTGSQGFNVAFRRHAQEEGYTINEHTMKPVKEGVEEPPRMETEEDIFAFLGLKYVKPEDRASASNVTVVTSGSSK